MSEMSPARFSAFRLQHVLDGVELASAEPSRFALNWFNGHWDEDRAEGARLYFPASSPDDAAILQVWSTHEMPEPLGSTLVGPVVPDPALVASGNTVLAAIDAPVRLGDPLSRLQGWPGAGAMRVGTAVLEGGIA